MSETILASASPRRKELLANIGLDFRVLVPDADETKIDKDVPPHIYVQELALLKAAAAGKLLGRARGAVIISADTIVVNDGEILGKPKTGYEAYKMLKSLSGKAHRVYTGFCVLRMRDSRTVCRHVCTRVRFKPLSDERIKRYVESGEPMDKAGAYGIQGLGSMLVEGIDGDYFNVVGLPVSALADVLEEEFDYKLM